MLLSWQRALDPYKPGMVVPCCIPALGRERQKNQKYKVFLNKIASLRLAGIYKTLSINKYRIRQTFSVKIVDSTLACIVPFAENYWRVRTRKQRSWAGKGRNGVQRLKKLTRGQREPRWQHRPNS